MRVFLTNLVDLHVFPVENVLQIVMVHEILNPIGSEVPSSGHFHFAQKCARFRCFVDDLLGQEQTGTLTAQLPMAGGRVDDLTQQIIEILNVDEPLSDIDEVEAFGKEATNERYPQTLLGIERKFVLLYTDVAIALDTLHDLSERSVLVFERSHQKAGLVLFDPSSHTIEDLGLAQMFASDPECLGCQVGGVAGSVLRKRPISIGGKAWLARQDRPAATKEFLGLLDSAPAQVIDQFA